jgi:hypothetical protein
MTRAGTLPLDPRLAELLGLSEKTRARAPQVAAPAAVAPRPAVPQMPVAPPVRQRQVQQI